MFDLLLPIACLALAAILVCWLLAHAEDIEMELDDEAR